MSDDGDRWKKIKKEKVGVMGKMFDSQSPSQDFLNYFYFLGTT